MRSTPMVLILIASLGLSGSASASPAAAPAPASDAEVKPIRRFTPQRNMVELGVFGGLMIFNRSHDLYAASTTPGEPIRRPTADLGIRAAFFPLRFLGVEAEFAALPAKYAAAASGPGGRGFIYGLRGHAILQLPLYRVVPFVLGGYGMMGVSSASTVAGKDIDPVGHLGGGVKYYLNRWLALRADARGYIGARARQWPGTAGHFEALLGLSVTLNRGKPKADPDPDRDGFRADDRCRRRPRRLPRARQRRRRLQGPGRQVPAGAGRRPRRLPRARHRRRRLHRRRRQVRRSRRRRARRLPAARRRRRRHPRQGRQVRPGAGDPQRLRGHRRLPRRGAERGDAVHGRDRGDLLRF